MKPAIPIFQQTSRLYRADNCRPLRLAKDAGLLSFTALSRDQYPGDRLRTKSLPQLKSIGYWDARLAQNWGLDWHRNEGIEFTFLERGRLDFAAEEKIYQLEPDDLIITRPWQLHRVGNPHVTPGRLHWLIIDVGMRRPHQRWTWPAWIGLTDADRRDLNQLLRNNEEPVWRGDREVRRCFGEIAIALDRHRYRSQLSRLSALVSKLLISILDSLRDQTAKKKTEKSTAALVVETFWTDLSRQVDRLAEPWTLAGMANHCSLGPTRFSFHSKRFLNASPMQALSKFRLEMAAQRIKHQSTWSIARIAHELGFASSQYFATEFRGHFHTTPTQFRRLFR